MSQSNIFVVNDGIPILAQFGGSEGSPLIINKNTDALYYNLNGAVHQMAGNFGPNLVLSKASGTGIQVDNVTPTFPW